MELKVVFVIVCLSAVAITFTDAGIPRCCINVKEKIPRKLFFKTERWSWQDGSGACNIDAVVLYLKGKKTPLCVSPKWRLFVEKIEREPQMWKMRAY